MDLRKLRAWWSQRQGLTSKPLTASASAVLAQSGWARSVGGCGPYLTLFSRAGISREAVDKAVANLEIHELPSARACTYVLPAADYALALRLAQDFGAADVRTAEKLGVTAKEIDKAREAVLLALEKAPLEPDDIRQAVGKAVRSLGPEGQKKGMSSTLPLALAQLQKSGDIRRISTNGRLDQQRYRYALWRPNPLRGKTLDFEEACRQLAGRFFDWIAPARVSDFQAFAGISAKAAKAAVEPLKLESVLNTSDLLVLPSQRSEFESFKAPNDPSYHLLISIDSLLLLRHDLHILVDEKDLASPLIVPKSGGTLMELPSPAIVDRGRVVGLWEYDPTSESIAYATLIKKGTLLKEAVAKTEEYVRTQLGDARTFSLDSPKSRQPRIEALRISARSK